MGVGVRADVGVNAGADAGAGGDNAENRLHYAAFVM